MQDNNIDVFISDAEIEYFELSKPISDQTWDEFVRERKAISLEFSRKFNFNLVLSEPAIVSLIDSIAEELSHHIGKEIRQPTKQQLNCLFANLFAKNLWKPDGARGRSSMPCIGTISVLTFNLINSLAK